MTGRTELNISETELADHSLRAQWQRARVHCLLALAVTAGVLLGAVSAWPVWGWLIAAGVMGVAAALACWFAHDAAARRWGVLMLVALSAAWFVVRTAHVAAHDIAAHVGAEPQLAEVTGRVLDEPRLRPNSRGAFAAFAYQPPATMLTLEVSSVVAEGAERPAAGRLLVKVAGADYRLKAGQQVRMWGWLSAIDGPRNPGEFDYRRWYRSQGVRGRLSVPTRDNWQLLGSRGGDGLLPWVEVQRAALGDLMQRGLWLGMADPALRTGALEAGSSPEGAPMALLEALLLGRWRPEMQEIVEPFRLTGLAHLLSISGAHLGILLGLTWLLVRLVVPHPRWAALVLLAVLLLYMAIIPPRVPIVRSAVMAAMFCLGTAAGRGVPGLAMLAWATVLVLIWRPGDLFDPGFQLSFGVVAALLLFVRPVSAWLWPPGLRGLGRTPNWGELALRRFVDYVAVSVVAFFVALPVVAYHWLLISPLAILWSVASLPFVTLVLGVGYVKMLVSPLFPSLSIAMGSVLGVLANWMIALVNYAATLPGAAVELRMQPSLVWVAAVLVVVAAVFAGAFAKRRAALAMSLTVVVGWTTIQQETWGSLPWIGATEVPAMRIDSFAVGDGSCHLVRLAGQGATPHTLMFDCGSQQYLDVGLQTVVPALRALHVDRIDTLVISHPDMDHFSGALDLMDIVPVGRVLVPQAVLDDAEDEPRGATAHLLGELRRRGVQISLIERGWQAKVGGAHLEALWPREGGRAKRNNDASVVLSIRAVGRRAIFCGDIGDWAVEQLLASGDDLQADVCELPHHGAFEGRSLDWLDAVGPATVIQSCGERRLRNDVWRQPLKDRGIIRLITAERGMVSWHSDE